VIQGLCAEGTLLSVAVMHSDPVGSMRSFTVFVGTESVSSMWQWTVMI
jgi:hypothetical protein